jgi:hypothetical protein
MTMEDFKNGKTNLKRVVVDIIALLAVFLVAYFLPDTLMPEMAKIGLLSIFMTKLLFVSAGVIHAHITRKMLFPYINFSHEPDKWNNIMVIVWYVVIISAWARGG